MALLFDSLWRAAIYCLHPRVLLLSLLPLAVMAVLAFGLGYFYWDDAVLAMRTLLESSAFLASIWDWLKGHGMAGVADVIAPLMVVLGVLPLLVILSLLLVAVCMTPALVAMVAARRFPALERKAGASFLASVVWSVGSTLLALIALLVSVPLWLVPPLVLILPPLIWGWLTYRVMAFDALANHASKAERLEIFRRHRYRLLGIGIVAGYLGAAPSLVWASGVVFAAAFVVLVPVAVWIYTLVFAFSSLWFSHYCLAALAQLRTEPAWAAPSPAPSAPVWEAEPSPPVAVQAPPSVSTMPSVTPPSTPPSALL